jgi:hypothetical protein
VQAQVDAGGDAGRGHHVALVDVQHAGVDLDLREHARQALGVGPVGGGAAAVEQAGGGQRERAGADRADPGTAGVSRAQGLERRAGQLP